MQARKDSTCINASAPCSHLIIIIQTDYEIATIVEVLAQSENVYTLIYDLLSNSLCAVASWAVAINCNACHSLRQSIDIKGASCESLIDRSLSMYAYCSE